MRFARLPLLSTIDWPGRLAWVTYTVGCNYCCPWCHNPALAYPQYVGDSLSAEEIIDALRERRSITQNVVITGGEPTIHDMSLATCCEKLKGLGYHIKLDTNGSNASLTRLLLERELIDEVALDYKAPLNMYQNLILGSSPNQVQLSIKTLEHFDRGLLRTTLVRGIHTPEVIRMMRRELKELKVPGLAKRWTFQRMRPAPVIQTREEKELHDGII